MIDEKRIDTLNRSAAAMRLSQLAYALLDGCTLACYEEVDRPIRRAYKAANDLKTRLLPLDVYLRTEQSDWYWTKFLDENSKIVALLVAASDLREDFEKGIDACIETLNKLKNERNDKVKPKA